MISSSWSWQNDILKVRVTIRPVKMPNVIPWLHTVFCTFESVDVIRGSHVYHKSLLLIVKFSILLTFWRENWRKNRISVINFSVPVLTFNHEKFWDPEDNWISGYRRGGRKDGKTRGHGWEFINQAAGSCFLFLMVLLGPPFLWLCCSSFSFLVYLFSFLSFLRFLFLVVKVQFLFLSSPNFQGLEENEGKELSSNDRDFKSQKLL